MTILFISGVLITGSLNIGGLILKGLAILFAQAEASKIISFVKERTGLSEDAWEKLAIGVRASDAKAFEHVYQKLYPIVLSYLWRMTKDESTTKDLTQDVFLKLWSKRATLDPAKSIIGFVLTIARNRFYNFQRDNKRVVTTPMEQLEQEQPPMIEESVTESEFHVQLRRWLLEMPPKRREAFELSRFEGLSHHEISEVMSIAPQTVNRHIVMALQTIREKLNTYDPNWLHP